MRRIFWFALGAGVTIFVVVRARDYLRQATPQAIGHRVADAGASLGDSVRDFTDRVRAGMAEREAELRESLNLPEQP